MFEPERKFPKAFPAFVCEGDSIDIEIDGLTVTARIERDDTIDRPDQRDDGFWPSKDPRAAGWIGDKPEKSFDEQMEQAKAVMKAWEDDDWWYCGIVLSVTKFVDIEGRVPEEVKIADHAASLWGIECNYPGSDNSYLTEVANELLEEALDHAKKVLDQL